MSGVLEGIKVVEMGAYVTAPSATSLMADWGADVIKVEPLIGEAMRWQHRSWGVDLVLKYPGGEVNFIQQLYNRNKRSVALDFKTKQGKEIVFNIIRQADILVTNYVPRVLREQNLDYDSLKEINPRLIHVLITGYGTKGPDKDERGYDQTAAWGRSGVMDRIGHPGGPPTVTRIGLFDRGTGAQAALGAMAALYRRTETGVGQAVEVSLYQTAVWMNSYDVQTALMGFLIPRHDRSVSGPLMTTYQARDERWFTLIMPDSDKIWPAFCQAIQRPDLFDNPKYDSNANRDKNSRELVKILEGVFATKSMDEWETIFRKYGIIYGKAFTLPEVVNDPQAIANDFYADLDHPVAGKMRLVASPIKFNGDSGEVKTPEPAVGQHTEEVLLELGYTWEDIVRFKDEKAVI